MRKSNKILAFVACLVLLTALVIGLVACDPAPSQHQHTAVDEWSSDANGHWHACVEDDDAKLDSDEHTFGEWLIDNDNKHYKKCSTCQYETAHEAHNLTINADKTKFTCECGYSEDHTHNLGNLIQDGANGHHQACTTEGCGYVTSTTSHNLVINAGKTAFECECGYSEAHTHQLGNPINDGATGHHQACTTQGCGYVTATGNHSLHINSDYTKYECECGYSENHTHTLVINEDKTKFTCTCGYSENHSHDLGALTPDGATGHYKECQTQGCGYRETNTHTLTINDDKTAFECECGYSEKHDHKLGALKSDGKEGHHQECETEGCGYVTEKSDHDLTINAEKTAFTCECGYSEEHTHTYGSNYISDGEDGHHQKCTTQGCGYETTPSRHDLKYVEDAGKNTHHATCNDCDYVGASVAHTPGKDATKVDDSNHAYKCTECNADVNEAHKTKVVADAEGGTHHTECEVCDYKSESVAHTSDNKYHKGEGKHWYECTQCNAKMDEAEHAQQGDIKSDENGHYYLCVCGEEVNRQTHTAGEVYSHDATNHWKTCSTCGYVLEKTAHIPGEEWQQDEEEGKHYKLCTECDERLQEGAHVEKFVLVSETQHRGECETCGKVTTAATTHDARTDEEITKTATSYHYYICKTCKGEARASHTYGLYEKVDDKQHQHTCTVCEYVSKANHTGYSTSSTSSAVTSKGEEGHTYVCSTCKLEVLVEHVFAWKQSDNNTKHYQECKFTNCKYTTEAVAHTVPETGVTQITGTTAANLAAAPNYHKFKCPVCSLTTAQAEHSWTHDEGGIDYCSVCDYSKWKLELTGSYYSIIGYNNGSEQQIGELTLPTSFKGTPIKALGGTKANVVGQRYNVFYYYTTSGQACDITKLVIPEGYTALNVAAFNNVIDELYLPASLETIEQNAFGRNSDGPNAKIDVKKVYFADFDKWLSSEVTRGGSNATPFAKASVNKNKTEIYIKQGDGDAYVKFTELVLNGDRDMIANYALYNVEIDSVKFELSGDVSIYFPKYALQKATVNKVYVSSIDDYAKKVEYEGSNNVFQSNAPVYIIGKDQPEDELTFGADINELGPYLFYGATFKKITIPETLLTVDYSSLQSLNGIEEIHVSSLKRFISLFGTVASSLWSGSGDAKFYVGGTETKDITIDDVALEELEGDTLKNLFTNCKTINSVTFKNTKDIALSGTFSNSSVSTVVFGDHITSMLNAFVSTPLKGEIRVPSATTELSQSFTGCDQIEVIYLPATLKYASAEFRGMTAKVIFAKDSTLEYLYAFGQNGDPYQGTEVVLPASLKSLRPYTYTSSTDTWKLSTNRTDILEYSPNVTAIYFGGDEQAWATLLDTIEDAVAKAKFQEHGFIFKDEYPGDELAATGKYWYYTDAGDTAIWMKGNKEKDGKYLMFDQYSYYVNIDDQETPFTLTPSKGEATFSCTADGINVTEAGVVTFTKAGKYTVKASLKDKADVYVDLTLIAYTNTYYLAGTLGGEEVAEKNETYTFSVNSEHEEYSLSAKLNKGDTFKLYAKDADGALAKAALDAEGSAGEEVFTIADDGTVTLAKDATYLITVKVTDGNKYTFTITEVSMITISIKIRTNATLSTLLASATIPLPSQDTVVYLSFTYDDIPEGKRSWTNIGFSVKFPDGSEDIYSSRTDKHIITFSSTAGWKADKGDNAMWYNDSQGKVPTTGRWTFGFTVTSEGALKSCKITTW